MTLFEEWWATYKNSGRKRQLSVDALSLDAFRAGMLAAADVAERMYFTHTTDDGVISGEGVADELRKRANDGA